MLAITIDELPEHQIDRIRSHSSGTDVWIDPNLLASGVPLDQVEVIVTYGFDITKELLDQMPSLKWVQVFQTGVEHLPMDELEKRDITLTNVRGIYGAPISEYVMSIMLNYERHLPQFIRNKQARFWDGNLLSGELNGKTISILGAGTIGRAIAEKAKVFGMHVLGVNTSGKSHTVFDEMFAFEQMEQVIRRGDYVVALLPITPKTYRCIGREQFSLMKESAYFINIGRGELIDEYALIDCLANQRISGAALDVFQQEPLPENHPLWDADNLIITPHLSGKTVHFFQRCTDIFLDNLHFYQTEHTLLYAFDFAKGY